MRRSGEERGIVVIFALVLMGAVAMIATAFAVLVRTEKKAARNSCLATQAELAAISGMEHAMEVAHRTYSFACSPDGAFDSGGTFHSTAQELESGWHRYFEDASGQLLSDATKWVSHYAGHEMRGHVFPYGEVRVGPPMTQVTCNGEYAVCVVDLDGKLHAVSSKWGEDLSAEVDKDSIIENVFSSLIPTPFTTGDEVKSLLDLDPPPRSIREIASRALPKPANPTAAELETWRKKTYAVEAYLRPYPIGSALAPLNINTARVETIRAALEATLSQVPSLSDANLVLDYILSRRPYASRAHFEDALFQATANDDGTGGLVALNWDSDNDKYLTETQFNDILNWTSKASGLGPYADPTGSGAYSFDGWENYEDNIGPSQTGPDFTPSADDAAAWGCEFKFTSRYFHIYAVGLVRDPDATKVLARKKLHAVYDAEDDRILWFRWNVTERGNIGDYIKE